MGAYLYKLNGKIIKALDEKTGEVIKIAVAPYYTKPWSNEWQWFTAIEDFQDSYDEWMSSTERQETRERELWSAGIYKHGESDWDYVDRCKPYWRTKRRVLQAKKYYNRFEEEGIKFVVFGEHYEHNYHKPNAETHYYELNGYLWSDEPNYGTPMVGKLVKMEKGINKDGSRITYKLKIDE